MDLVYLGPVLDVVSHGFRMDAVPTVLVKNSDQLVGLHQLGPSCLKLTTSFVNDLLIFQT